MVVALQATDAQGKATLTNEELAEQFQLSLDDAKKVRVELRNALKKERGIILPSLPRGRAKGSGKKTAFTALLVEDTEE